MTSWIGWLASLALVALLVAGAISALAPGRPWLFGFSGVVVLLGCAAAAVSFAASALSRRMRARDERQVEDHGWIPGSHSGSH